MSTDFVIYNGNRMFIDDVVVDLARRISELESKINLQVVQPITDEARHLSNLLTRIHRDGGHYEDEHGTDKAVADAENKIAQLNAMTALWQEAIELLRKFMEYRNSYYVPNVLFSRAQFILDKVEIERLDRARGKK